MSELPDCDVDGCTTKSAYLFPSGDLCERHAAEKEPELYEYCRAVLGRPPAAEL